MTYHTCHNRSCEGNYSFHASTSFPLERVNSMYIILHFFYVNYIHFVAFHISYMRPREVDEDFCSLSYLALHPQLRVVLGDDVFDDGQPQTGAAG